MNPNSWLKVATRKSKDPKNYGISYTQRESKFDPDHDTVAEAMRLYLADGGKITVIEEIEDAPVNYGHTSSSFFSDDEL